MTDIQTPPAPLFPSPSPLLHGTNPLDRHLSNRLLLLESLFFSNASSSSTGIHNHHGHHLGSLTMATIADKHPTAASAVSAAHWQTLLRKNKDKYQRKMKQRQRVADAATVGGGGDDTNDGGDVRTTATAAAAAARSVTSSSPYCSRSPSPLPRGLHRRHCQSSVSTATSSSSSADEAEEPSSTRREPPTRSQKEERKCRRRGQQSDNDDTSTNTTMNARNNNRRRSRSRSAAASNHPPQRAPPQQPLQHNNPPDVFDILHHEEFEHMCVPILLDTSVADGAVAVGRRNGETAAGGRNGGVAAAVEPITVPLPPAFLEEETGSGVNNATAAAEEKEAPATSTAAPQKPTAAERRLKLLQLLTATQRAVEATIEASTERVCLGKQKKKIRDGGKKRFDDDDRNCAIVDDSQQQEAQQEELLAPMMTSSPSLAAPSSSFTLQPRRRLVVVEGPAITIDRHRADDGANSNSLTAAATPTTAFQCDVGAVLKASRPQSYFGEGAVAAAAAVSFSSSFFSSHAPPPHRFVQVMPTQRQQSVTSVPIARDAVVSLIPAGNTLADCGDGDGGAEPRCRRHCRGGRGGEPHLRWYSHDYDAATGTFKSAHSNNKSGPSSSSSQQQQQQKSRVASEEEAHVLLWKHLLLKGSAAAGAAATATVVNGNQKKKDDRSSSSPPPPLARSCESMGPSYALLAALFAPAMLPSYPHVPLTLRCGASSGGASGVRADCNDDHTDDHHNSNDKEESSPSSQSRRMNAVARRTDVDVDENNVGSCPFWTYTNRQRAAFQQQLCAVGHGRAMYSSDDGGSVRPSDNRNGGLCNFYSFHTTNPYADHFLLMHAAAAAATKSTPAAPTATEAPPHMAAAAKDVANPHHEHHLLWNPPLPPLPRMPQSLRSQQQHRSSDDDEGDGGETTKAPPTRRSIPTDAAIRRILQHPCPSSLDVMDTDAAYSNDDDEGLDAATRALLQQLGPLFCASFQQQKQSQLSQQQLQLPPSPLLNAAINFYDPMTHAVFITRPLQPWRSAQMDPHKAMGALAHYKKVFDQNHLVNLGAANILELLKGLMEEREEEEKEEAVAQKLSREQRKGAAELVLLSRLFIGAQQKKQQQEEQEQECDETKQYMDSAMATPLRRVLPNCRRHRHLLPSRWPLDDHSHDLRALQSVANANLRGNTHHNHHDHNAQHHLIESLLCDTLPLLSGEARLLSHYAAAKRAIAGAINNTNKMEEREKKEREDALAKLFLNKILLSSPAADDSPNKSGNNKNSNTSNRKANTIPDIGPMVVDHMPLWGMGVLHLEGPRVRRLIIGNGYNKTRKNLLKNFGRGVKKIFCRGSVLESVRQEGLGAVDADCRAYGATSGVIPPMPHSLIGRKMKKMKPMKNNKMMMETLGQKDDYLGDEASKKSSRDDAEEKKKKKKNEKVRSPSTSSSSSTSSASAAEIDIDEYIDSVEQLYAKQAQSRASAMRAELRLLKQQKERWVAAAIERRREGEGGGGGGGGGGELAKHHASKEKTSTTSTRKEESNRNNRLAAANAPFAGPTASTNEPFGDDERETNEHLQIHQNESIPPPIPFAACFADAHSTSSSSPSSFFSPLPSSIVTDERQEAFVLDLFSTIWSPKDIVAMRGELMLLLMSPMAKKTIPQQRRCGGGGKEEKEGGGEGDSRIIAEGEDDNDNDDINLSPLRGDLATLQRIFDLKRALANASKYCHDEAVAGALGNTISDEEVLRETVSSVASVSSLDSIAAQQQQSDAAKEEGELLLHLLQDIVSSFCRHLIVGTPTTNTPDVPSTRPPNSRCASIAHPSVCTPPSITITALTEALADHFKSLRVTTAVKTSVAKNLRQQEEANQQRFKKNQRREPKNFIRIKIRNVYVEMAPSRFYFYPHTDRAAAEAHAIQLAKERASEQTQQHRREQNTSGGGAATEGKGRRSSSRGHMKHKSKSGGKTKKRKGNQATTSIDGDGHTVCADGGQSSSLVGIDSQRLIGSVSTTTVGGGGGGGLGAFNVSGSAAPSLSASQQCHYTPSPPRTNKDSSYYPNGGGRGLGSACPSAVSMSQLSYQERQNSLRPNNNNNDQCQEHNASGDIHLYHRTGSLVSAATYQQQQRRENNQDDANGNDDDDGEQQDGPDDEEASSSSSSSAAEFGASRNSTTSAFPFLFTGPISAISAALSEGVSGGGGGGDAAAISGTSAVMAPPFDSTSAHQHHNHHYHNTSPHQNQNQNNNNINNSFFAESLPLSAAASLGGGGAVAMTIMSSSGGGERAGSTTSSSQLRHYYYLHNNGNGNNNKRRSSPSPFLSPPQQPPPSVAATNAGRGGGVGEPIALSVSSPPVNGFGGGSSQSGTIGGGAASGRGADGETNHDGANHSTKQKKKGEKRKSNEEEEKKNKKNTSASSSSSVSPATVMTGLIHLTVTDLSVSSRLNLALPCPVALRGEGPPQTILDVYKLKTKIDAIDLKITQFGIRGALLNALIAVLGPLVKKMLLSQIRKRFEGKRHFF